MPNWAQALDKALLSFTSVDCAGQDFHTNAMNLPDLP